MSKKKEDLAKQQEMQEEISRLRTPRGKQTFGILEQRLGGSRMRIRCLDGRLRICRIPGRLKRSLWVREGDIVIVEPWEYSGDERGDILYKYSKNQAIFLKNKGYLSKLELTEEF